MHLKEIKKSLARWMTKHPVQPSMKHRYFNIIAERNIIRCKCYYRSLKRINTVVLYAHGFGGHKDNRAAEKFAKRALERNKHMIVLAFNWPCHGDDVKKELSLGLCATYLREILKFIRTTYAPEHLFGYATSFGGYLYLKYIHEHGMPFERAALRCPAVPMYDVLTKTIMKEPELALASQGNTVLVGFDRKVPVTKAFLEELRATDLRLYDYQANRNELLILQGLIDEVVPPDAVMSFAQQNQIRCIPIENADHRFRKQKAMNRAIREIIRFFQLQ